MFSKPERSHLGSRKVHIPMFRRLDPEAKACHEYIHSPPHGLPFRYVLTPEAWSRVCTWSTKDGKLGTPYYVCMRHVKAPSPSRTPPPPLPTHMGLPFPIPIPMIHLHASYPGAMLGAIPSISKPGIESICVSAEGHLVRLSSFSRAVHCNQNALVTPCKTSQPVSREAQRE